MVGSLRICVWKDADTSDMAVLTVTRKSFCLFFVPNLFLGNDAANDGTIIVLCYCGIPPNNFSVIPECVINVHHLSQLPDFLDAVALTIMLVVSRLPLVMIHVI